MFHKWTKEDQYVCSRKSQLDIQVMKSHTSLNYKTYKLSGMSNRTVAITTIFFITLQILPLHDSWIQVTTHHFCMVYRESEL